MYSERLYTDILSASENYITKSRICQMWNAKETRRTILNLNRRMRLFADTYLVNIDRYFYLTPFSSDAVGGVRFKLLLKPHDLILQYSRNLCRHSRRHLSFRMPQCGGLWLGQALLPPQLLAFYRTGYGLLSSNVHWPLQVNQLIMHLVSFHFTNLK